MSKPIENPCPNCEHDKEVLTELDSEDLFDESGRRFSSYFCSSCGYRTDPEPYENDTYEPPFPTSL